MTQSPRHLADEHLSRLEPSVAQVPANRAMAIRNAFRDQFGRKISLLTEGEYKKQIVEWLDGAGDEQGAHLHLDRKGGPRRSVHPTLGHKALWLQSQECRVCDVHLGPGIPVRFGIRISPFSAQTRNQGLLGARKQAIHNELLEDRIIAQNWPADLPVCIQITVLAGSGRAMDVDNMVKGILDALQGVLYQNDSAIHHLNVVRLSHPLEEGFYLVHARPARPLVDDVIDDQRCDVRWKQRIIEV